MKNLIPVEMPVTVGWKGFVWLVWVLIRVNHNARGGRYVVKIEALFPMPWW